MWFFQAPKIAFGEDALQELTSLQGHKAFIVTDPVMVKLGYAGIVRSTLESSGFSIDVFSEVEPDPSLETVQQCAKSLAASGADWVIGLGGGSCMDAAKAAWFIYERPDIELDAINPFEQFGLRAKARLAMIPTTAGTGADVSWGFALNDRTTKSKLVRVSRELIPDIAILDPQFTLDLPAQVTADAGMDALTHAVEAYTNTWANDFSDAMAIKAIQLVFDYLPLAYINSKDMDARTHMQNAASMAGLAFSNTAIILAHALAHAIGATFETHHGRTVGMILPYTMEYNARTHPDRFIELAQQISLSLAYKDSSVDPAYALAAAIRKFARQIRQPLSIADLGISHADFSAALPHLITYSISAIELLANPRQPTDDEIERIFQYAYRGTPVDF